MLQAIIHSLLNTSRLFHLGIPFSLEKYEEKC